MLDAILHALWMAFAMGWEILWPLILGFALSGVVQAVVSHQEMSRLLPDDSPRSIAIALGLGAASSSCSYAAVAITRSIFHKGANFTAAMAFELASTNLVLELSIILIVLMGWQFMLAEAIGAPIMMTILVLLFRLFLRREMVEEAKAQADRGIPGRMEGHAEMDMSVSNDRSLWQRITSPEGFTAISQYFVMDWASVWMDIVGGFPRNVLRVVPLRPISRGHGTSSPSSPPWTALRRLLAAPWGLLRVMRAWGSLPIDCRSASVRFTTVAGGEQRLPSSGVFGSMHLVNLVYYAPALSET
jgi:hypothetical protein